MSDEMTDQEIHQERLDAIELILEVVLPMLISAAPNQKDIRQRLLQLAQTPPSHMKDNTALPFLVDAIELACPDDAASPL